MLVNTIKSTKNNEFMYLFNVKCVFIFVIEERCLAGWKIDIFGEYVILFEKKRMKIRDVVEE